MCCSSEDSFDIILTWVLHWIKLFVNIKEWKYFNLSMPGILGSSCFPFLIELLVEMEACLSVNKCHHPFPSPSLTLESSLPAAAMVGIFQEVTLACINQIQNTQKSFLLTCWLDVKFYRIHFLSKWGHLVKRRYTEDSSNLMYCIKRLL